MNRALVYAFGAAAAVELFLGFGLAIAVGRADARNRWVRSPRRNL